jgi:hypothetical protein
MPKLLSVEVYIEAPEKAIELLAFYLKEGSLALAIGAGASAGLGLPNWKKLVTRCIKQANSKHGLTISDTIPDNASNKYICKIIDSVEKGVGGKLDMGRSKSYRDMIKTCLYEGISYEESIIQQKLLIALGALLMGSKRGNIRHVINFNFDDVLEWYLRLHGFDTQIVTNLPNLLKEPDVTIYHPHGFLPKRINKNIESDFLIFSQHSYDTKMGKSKELWLNHFETLMAHRVILFVGLSGDDQTFGPKLAEVQSQLESTRFTGFWLFGPDMKAEDMEYFIDRNIVPLKFNSFEDIPRYLLKICQKASNG